MDKNEKELSDLTIDITFRSSQADVKLIEDYLKVIVTSLKKSSNLDIALIEKIVNLKFDSEKTLTTLNYKLSI